MFKLCLALSMSLYSVSLSAIDPAPSISGIWLGEVDAKVLKYRVAFEILRTSSGGLSAKMHTPDFSLGNPPVEEIKFEKNNLRLELPRRGLVYEGKLDAAGQELSGNLVQNGTNMPLKLKKTGELPAGKIDEADAPVRGEAGESIASYHPLAADIGYRILHSGGNAFDAFVAATFAEYVLAPGVTTPAGPLAVLAYDTKEGKVKFLDATCNELLDPAGRWDPKNPKAGATFWVPGAVAGLEELSRKHGRLPFAKALEPAIRLAELGFPLDLRYVGTVLWREQVLKQSEAGRNLLPGTSKQTYVNGKIRLPELAGFLKRLAKQGSPYFYRGDWAKQCVKEVARQGGRLSLEDLASYKVEWREPWHTSYRGLDLHSTAGPVYGGLITLQALKVLEKGGLPKGKHYSQSADGLERMVRIFRESKAAVRPVDENGYFKPFPNPVFGADLLEGPQVEAVWKRVRSKGKPSSTQNSGSHSYHLVVRDKEGNIVSGIHTISSMPWGEGLFVEGVPLNGNGQLLYESTQSGQRALSAFSLLIALKKGKPKLALGAFNVSLLEASFQFAVNMIDYALPAKEALSLPRFGANSWDGKGLWLDPRVDSKIVKSLAARGLHFSQEGWVDTGQGAAVLVREDRGVEGATAPR